MIDIADIRRRWRQAASFLYERARRLFAVNEALAQGHGGVTATSIATGLARSTVDRGIEELRFARNDLGPRLRRPGGGRKSAVTHQPGLPVALEKLIEDAIRGDPCSLSGGQRTANCQALTVRRLPVSHVLRCGSQPCCRQSQDAREGRNRNGSSSTSMRVRAAIAAGGLRYRWIRKKELVGDFKNNGRNCVLKVILNGAVHDLSRLARSPLRRL